MLLSVPRMKQLSNLSQSVSTLQSSRTVRTLCAGAAALAASLAAAPASAAPMQVSGNRLLDSCGQPFVVRGVEQILGNQLPPGNDWLGLIEQIAASGANAVRVLPGVNTLTVADVDSVLTFIGEKGMIAFIDPLNSPDDWFARPEVKRMLQKHESYIIIDAYGEPQYDDRDTWREEAAQALRDVRALGYRVPLTVTANQFGRDLPSLFEYGEEIMAADPQSNTFLGWQAYWGQGGYYQSHYGLSLSAAVDAIVASGLPIQMGLDHITDLPAEAADFSTLMNEAEVHGIGWLWWDWFNPYGSENNLSTDGSVDRLTTTGRSVVNTHSASLANTARYTCSGEPAAPVVPTVPTVPVVPTPTPPAVPATQAPISINAGGSRSGTFVADQSFTGIGSAASSTARIDRSRVTNPAPEAVYQDERWGEMTYVVGGFVPNSKHKVRLHLAELYFSSAGRRQFNVRIQKTRVLTNYDIFARAGAKNRAIVETFETRADSDGNILVKLGNGALDVPALGGLVIE
jgi:hypothetical protein